MKKALLFLFTVLALFAFISCDNSVDYPFDDDIPAVETPEMVPLTFEFIKDGKIIITNKTDNMVYSRNSGAKQPVEGEIRAESGDRIKLFATRTSADVDKYLNINCTGDCYIYGNVMSLIQEEGIADKKDVFDYAFFNLFSGNTHIKSHSSKKLVLPATTLAESCYSGMFEGCTSLTKAPELKATVLADNCYSGMFQGCTSLTSAPELKAEILVSHCYEKMFSGCSSLDYIKCLATNPESGNTYNWVEGVATDGFFEKADSVSVDVWTIGTSGIPKNWYCDPKYVPLTLEFIKDGTIEINNRPEKLKYTKNEGEILSATDRIDVKAGDRIRFYANRTIKDDLNINCDADCYIYGNVMSLIKEEGFADKEDVFSSAFSRLFEGNEKINLHDSKKLVLPATILTRGCYYNMFQKCTKLTKVPELPATTLAEWCYAGMFLGCTSLTTAPELPATTLADNCYYYMFFGCTSLVNAPALPATTMKWDCYGNMFESCSSLTTAPELPATTLAHYCYGGMFKGCTNLLVAPELPAETLVDYCYQGMFYACERLNSITCLATNISAGYCTEDWLKGISSSGTFTKASSMNDWSTGESGIPSGWTVINQ